MVSLHAKGRLKSMSEEEEGRLLGPMLLSFSLIPLSWGRIGFSKFSLRGTQNVLRSKYFEKLMYSAQNS
jgi:hypothetical protein